MSFAPFLTLEEENRINPQKRQMDYQYNGRLFIPPKTLNIKQNGTQTLDSFYNISQFQNTNLSTITSTLRNMFFTQGNIDLIYSLLRASGAPTSYITSAVIKETMRKVFADYAISNTESAPTQLNTLNQMVVDSITNVNKTYQKYDSKRIIDPGESTNKRAYDLFYGQAQEQPLNTSIITNQIEPNKLTSTYFSKRNLDYIQQRIMEGIAKQGFNITRQSDTQVQIVMRSIYFQFSKNNNQPLQLQLDELNNLVIDECIRIILPNIQQYQGYIRDVTNPIPTLPSMQSTTIKGSNTFSLFVA